MHFNTYSHLDAQLQLRHFWDLLRRSHMRVRVHYGSFHRRCRSYVSLKILSDGSNMWYGVVVPLTRHLPTSGQKSCGICSCFVFNRSPERRTITSMKLSMSEPRGVYFWIGPCSENRYLPSWYISRVNPSSRRFNYLTQSSRSGSLPDITCKYHSSPSSI